MKRLALTLLALLALCVGAQAQGVGPQPILCNKSAPATVAVGTVQLIAPVANQAITYCGFEATAAAASTFQLIFGVGATCGTNTVNLTAPYDMSVSGVLTGTGRQVSGAGGAAATAAGLCVIVGGTGPVHITVYYSQQ